MRKRTNRSCSVVHTKGRDHNSNNDGHDKFAVSGDDALADKVTFVQKFIRKHKKELIYEALIDWGGWACYWYSYGRDLKRFGKSSHPGVLKRTRSRPPLASTHHKR
jgi:hypothetical protein